MDGRVSKAVIDLLSRHTLDRGIVVWHGQSTAYARLAGRIELSEVRLLRYEDSFLRLRKHLKLCRAEGTYLKELARIQKQDLFILDDMGLEPFDTHSRLSLLEILEDRHGRASTMVVSQIPVSEWHHLISEATIANAICDRIVHTAHRIELEGESVRKLYGRRTSRTSSNEKPIRPKSPPSAPSATL